MEDTKEVEKKKEAPKTTPIYEGNTGTLTVKLLDEMNRLVGLNYDVSVEVHKHLVSIDNRLQIIMEQWNKLDDGEESNG